MKYTPGCSSEYIRGEDIIYKKVLDPKPGCHNVRWKDATVDGKRNRSGRLRARYFHNLQVDTKRNEAEKS